jgi:DCN1-like protein 1/2
VEEETSDDDEDEAMEEDREPKAGWSEKHTQWWFEFLGEKAGKGISRDTWNMVRNFSISPCCTRISTLRFTVH